MTRRDEMVETIMRAREEGNIKGLMAAFHPHAVFELKGDKRMLEVAGTVEGHSNVQAALAQFIKNFQFRKRDNRGAPEKHVPSVPGLWAARFCYLYPGKMVHFAPRELPACKMNHVVR
jgi:hypothetical protein